MMSVESEGSSLLHVVLAFTVVFALLGAFGFALRYVTAKGLKMPGLTNRTSRLQLVETLAIDIRRRVVIVRCDQQEHLLLLGTNNDVVIATNLTTEPPKP